MDITFYLTYDEQVRILSEIINEGWYFVPSLFYDSPIPLILTDPKDVIEYEKFGYSFEPMYMVNSMYQQNKLCMHYNKVAHKYTIAYRTGVPYYMYLPSCLRVGVTGKMIWGRFYRYSSYYLDETQSSFISLNEYFFKDFDKYYRMITKASIKTTYAYWPSYYWIGKEAIVGLANGDYVITFSPPYIFDGMRIERFSDGNGKFTGYIDELEEKLTRGRLTAERRKLLECMLRISLRYTEDEESLLSDLRGVGIRIRSICDLVNTKESYHKAIPVLLQHLDAGHNDITVKGIVKALNTDGAGSEVVPPLFELFKRTDPKSNWNMCLYSSEVMQERVDAATINPIIDYLKDDSKGKVRLLLIPMLLKFPTQANIDLLTRLSEDGELKVTAEWTLSEIKDAAKRAQKCKK